MSNTATRSSASSQGDQSPSFEDLKEKAKQRKTLREIHAKKRKDAYDQAKAEADNAYRSGKYDTAAVLYVRLAKRFGPGCTIYSNAAAASLKRSHPERYAQAEIFASDALKYEPRNIKARYRRALARYKQKRHSAAATDLEMILQIDPTCLDANKLLQEVDDALMSRGEDVEDPRSPDKLAHPHDAHPFITSPALPPPELDSDTEDCNHKGNGVPCLAYNHDGCTMGKACQFSHAPNDISLRDNLGRNVCTHYLLDDCPEGGDQCPFSHDKRFLPPGWWDHENLVEQAKEALEKGVQIEHLSTLNNSIAGLSAQLGGNFQPSDLISKLPEAIQYGASMNERAGVPLWAPGRVPAKPYPLA